MRRKPARFKMATNHSVREKLGIPQEEFAWFCGVSKAAISMMETHRRGWPATDKVTHLLTAYRQAEAAPSDVSVYEKTDAREKNVLEWEFLKLKGKHFHLAEQLDAMKFAYAQATALRRVCWLLHTTYPEESVQGKLLSAWQIRSELKINANRPFLQNRLQIKIEALEKEMAFISRELGQSPDV